MKKFITILIALCKILIAVKVLWWIFEKSTKPELHSFEEIELYVVVLIFDTWITRLDIKESQE
jgi:hypothetical protein